MVRHLELQTIKEKQSILNVVELITEMIRLAASESHIQNGNKKKSIECTMLLKKPSMPFYDIQWY